jgi:hypothetical protein
VDLILIDASTLDLVWSNWQRGKAGAFIAKHYTDPGAKLSVCHGVGGMFPASGIIIMSNEAAVGVRCRRYSIAPKDFTSRHA